jgi:hypothetical protein
MDEISRKRKDKIIKEHLGEVDIIITDFISELGDIDLTPEMLNDIFKLALQKWEFLYNHGLIKKAPL